MTGRYTVLGLGNRLETDEALGGLVHGGYVEWARRP